MAEVDRERIQWVRRQPGREELRRPNGVNPSDGSREFPYFVTSDGPIFVKSCEQTGDIGFEHTFCYPNQ